MIAQATQNLIARLGDPSASATDLGAAAQSLLNAVTGAAPGEANAVLTDLARYIALDDPSRAAFVALVCGALVERGCDPLALSESLNRRLPPLLEASARLADACRARVPKAEGDEDDPAAAFENARQQWLRLCPRRMPPGRR